MIEWIDVDKQLPQDSGYVLVHALSDEERIVNFGRFLGESKHDWDVGRDECDYILFDEVTHWMPLPEWPKIGGSK